VGLVDLGAAARARIPAHIPVEAVLVGDGPRWGKVAAAVRERNLSWVRLPGRASAEQVRAHYRAADIFVAPSVLESFGIAALEARCTGLPVVAFAQSGVRDIVADDREGLLVASDAAMVDALVRLCADDALRERISQHNRTTVAPFDWGSAMRRCDALYARAAGLAGRPLPAARPTAVPDAPLAGVPDARLAGVPDGRRAAAPDAWLAGVPDARPAAGSVASLAGAAPPAAGSVASLAGVPDARAAAGSVASLAGATPPAAQFPLPGAAAAPTR
jgi:hypothetical protein